MSEATAPSLTLGLMVGGFAGLILPAVLVCMACRRHCVARQTVLGFSVAVASWYSTVPSTIFLDWYRTRESLILTRMPAMMHVWHRHWWKIYDAVSPFFALGIVVGLALACRGAPWPVLSRRFVSALLGSAALFGLGLLLNQVGPARDEAAWLNALGWPFGLWMLKYVQHGYAGWPIAGFWGMWYWMLFQEFKPLLVVGPPDSAGRRPQPPEHSDDLDSHDPQIAGG